ncbi:MAG: hypothetical protein ACR2JD_07720 [Nocardioides sp.]
MSLPFIVAATQIGIALHALSALTGAAMVTAGLLSVLFFPLLALGLLRTAGPAEPAQSRTPPERPTAVTM